MKKRIMALLLTALIAISFVIPAFAAEVIFVDDELSYLNGTELKELNNYGEFLYKQTGCNYLFAFTKQENLDKYVPDAQMGETDDYILMVENEEEWFVATNGVAQSIISQADKNALRDKYDAEKYYIDAVKAYMTAAAQIIREANSSADMHAPRLADFADILSESEENTLISKLDEISNRQQVDVAVLTVDTLGGKTREAYADDFYDYNGYGYGENRDGILLLVSMENSDWYITTTGYGITAFTDAGIEYLSEQFLDDLGDGNYAAAFTTYAEKCDEFITQAKTGEPFDNGNLPKEPYDFLVWILISAVVGVVAAFIITSVMKGKLKTVRFQPAASNYVRQGSMNLTNSQDIFLYTHVDRRPRPKENSSGGSSTHSSSSGSTHGGGGGHF